MMREENNNPDIIRRVNRELSDVRKEQRLIRLWGSVLLGANLVLLGGSIWVLGLGIKRLEPQEAATGYPPITIPAGADKNAGGVVDVPDDTDVVDNTGTTGTPGGDVPPVGYAPQTGSAPSSVTADAAVGPVTTRPAPSRPTAARAAATAVPSHVTTHEGMTLRSLARRYYGSEVFWVCIYDRNLAVLSSTDTLPPGIRLELPRPADYGIDATDPTSLQRACKLAKSLAEQ